MTLGTSVINSPMSPPFLAWKCSDAKLLTNEISILTLLKLWSRFSLIIFLLPISIPGHLLKLSSTQTRSSMLYYLSVYLIYLSNFGLLYDISAVRTLEMKELFFQRFSIYLFVCLSLICLFSSSVHSEISYLYIHTNI